MMGQGLDLLIGALLVICAGAALRSTDLFRGIVFLIVFGLLVSLAWLRLRAPDLALAEAAVGAGLTGVLLVGALQRIRRRLGTRHHVD